MNPVMRIELSLLQKEKVFKQRLYHTKKLLISLVDQEIFFVFQESSLAMNRKNKRNV